MNNFFPPYFQPSNNYEIIQEINKLKEEIIKLNKKIELIEHNKNTEYMKKNDDYYII